MIYKYKDEYINILHIASAKKTNDGKLAIIMSNGNSHTIEQPDAKELTEILDSMSTVDFMDNIGGGSFGNMP